MSTVAVAPVVVLMAIRYGLGRATYAHSDAIALIRAHWPVLRQWRESLMDDVARVIANPHPVLSDQEITATEDVWEWIRGQA